MTQKITKIKIMSLAKIQGAMISFLVLIFGIIFTLLDVTNSLLSTHQYIEKHTNTLLSTSIIGINENGLINILISGLISIIITTTLYGIIGFICGGIIALLYNFIAKKIGPIEIELE